MSDDNGYYGSQGPGTNTSEYNALMYTIRGMINGRNHVAEVQVVAVDAPGGLAVAGTVDVRPLVNQLDGQGNAVPHGVVAGLPYIRIQGGSNAIIMDPQVGDIGLCLFCDRDSSAVQAVRGVANPGSLRRNDMSDGVYLGGLLNATPEQYIMFVEGGITISSPTNIKLEAPTIELVAETIDIDASTGVTMTTPKFTLNGDMDATGTIKAPIVNGTTNVLFGGKSGIAHQHTNGGLPSNPSGPPV